MTDNYLKKELYELIKSDESIFDFIQASSLDGLWYWDIENPENEWMNPKFWTVLGYNPEEMPHKSSAWQNIINPDDLKVALDNFTKHCEDPAHPYDQIVRYTHKNGSTIWIRCRGLAIRDKSGKPIRMLGAHHDITDIKNVEQQLKKARENEEESKLKFQNAFEHSGIGMALVNTQKRFTKVNKFFCRMLEYTNVELENMFIEDVTYFDDKNIGQDELAACVQGKLARFSVSKRYVTKTGRIVWGNLNVAIVRGPDLSKSFFIAQIVDITRQIEYQQSLLQAKELAEKNEVQNRAILQTAYDGFWLTDFKGNIFEVNDAYCKMSGYTRQELLTMRISDIEANESALEVDNHMIKVLKKGEDRFLSVHRKKDGSVYNVEASVKVVPELNERIVVFLRDITGFLKAEQQLINALESMEDSEKKYRGLFSNLISAFGLHEMIFNEKGEPLDYILLEVNPMWEKVVGIEASSVIGKSIREIMPAIEQSWIDRYGKIVLTGMSEEFVDYNEATQKYFNVFAYKLEGNKFAVVFNDVTEKKRFELEMIKAKEKAEESERLQHLQNKEIEQQNERLESLLRISQLQTTSIQELLDYALEEAIKLTYSKIGYIYFYNETTRQFILNTWSKEVMNECTVRDPQITYDLDKTGCWGEAVRQRKPIVLNNYAEDNPIKHGTPRGHIQLSKFLTIPVIIGERIVAVAGVANKEQDYNNADIRQLTLLMDAVWKISERISLIENLEKAKEKAEESDRLKSAFLANMSHEIRTPMNGILGFTNLLLKPDLNNEEKENYIKIVHKSGQRMLNTVNDIIEISKLEAGLADLRYEAVDFNKRVVELVQFFTQEASEKGLKLSLEKLLPEENRNLNTDKNKLDSILTNLIKNAIKYTQAGTISISCQIQASVIEFYIKDTGIGIPANRLNAIFNRFEQADIRDTKVFEGSGLGLAIAKSYVEMLGGKIWVESEEGKGSTFYFTLPAAKSEEKQANADAVLSDNGNLNSKTKGLKVLIAEDDEVSMNYLSILLKDCGKQILMAETGKEAVELCLRHPDIDLILMDIQMPEMGGYEASRQIREFNKEVIIIAQTAYALSGDREKVMAAGCNDYISKPVKKEVLQSLIEKYFG
ncbi:MAG: PAS domain S-box protein [Lentimicrobiaceae bacterium]|nr:PAS domain S-box protein [Lentimicrobiaceae bacterium]